MRELLPVMNTCTPVSYTHLDVYKRQASLLAGAKTIKATIYNNVTDDEAEDMSLSENLQREQVRPTEAVSYTHLSKIFTLPINAITALLGIPIVVWVVLRNKSITA